MSRKGVRQSPRAAWSKAILDLLSDGLWHDRAEVIAAGARAVPPGVAWRRAERHRAEEQINRVGRSKPRRYGDEHVAADVGARRVANDVLRAMVRSGKVLRKDNWYCLARLAEQKKEATG